GPLAARRAGRDSPRAAGSRGERARRAHDGDGLGDVERVEDDGQPDAADEPRAPGVDHARADGDRGDGGGVEVKKFRVPGREFRGPEVLAFGSGQKCGRSDSKPETRNSKL